MGDLGRVEGESVFAKRILTTGIVVPILSVLVIWGSERVFLVIILLVSGIALKEFLEMSLPSSKRIEQSTMALGLFSIFIIYYYRNLFIGTPSTVLSWYARWLLGTVTIAVFFLLLVQFIIYPRKVFLKLTPLTVFIGVVYVSLFLSYFILIRSGVEGRGWVLFSLVVVWFGDCGAYLMGTWKGNYKLSPAVSPHKTIEGALGGAVASMLAAIIANWLFLGQLTFFHCVILALGITVVGLVGDLCESTLKRINNVKDSGSILPGHGGMLDRIDSILFAAPFIYYYKILFI